MKVKYVALETFQVFDRGDGPRRLKVGEAVPTHYMSPGLIEMFVLQGRMEVAEEPAEEVLEVEIADARDVVAEIVALGIDAVSAKEGFDDEELEALRRSSSVEEVEMEV